MVMTDKIKWNGVSLHNKRGIRGKSWKGNRMWEGGEGGEKSEGESMFSFLPPFRFPVYLQSLPRKL